MKSAEEWRISIEKRNLVTGGFLQEQIKRIQLDAMKEGMRRAAQIAEDNTFALGKKTEWEQAYDKGCLDSQAAILTAAEQLTEKDL